MGFVKRYDCEALGPIVYCTHAQSESIKPQMPLKCIKYVVIHIFITLFGNCGLNSHIKMSEIERKPELMCIKSK